MSENSSHSENPNHIVVLGLMGVGKSTTAGALAKRLDGWEERDSDRDLELIFGQTGAELADELGVPELHRLESAMLLGALGSERPSVISAAASIVEDERCREALTRRARVVFLHLPIERLKERIETGDHRREIDFEEMARIIERRMPLFKSVWDVSLEATMSTGDLVDAVLDSPRFAHVR